MKKILILVFLLFGLNDLYAASALNCNISNMQTTRSASNFVIVIMDCKTTDPIPSGTNGCTASAIKDDSFTFDVTDEQGKLNYSILLSAWLAGKRVYASSYATCPSVLPNVPLLYSLKTFND